MERSQFSTTEPTKETSENFGTEIYDNKYKMHGMR